MEQLEHVTEVMFVFQSLTTKYHSFHFGSRLDEHIDEIIRKTCPSGEFKRYHSLGKCSYSSHLFNHNQHRDESSARVLGKKAREEVDMGGTRPGDRCVTEGKWFTNPPRAKCLRPRTKERRGEINEKERETASTDDKQEIMKKHRRDKRWKRRIPITITLACISDDWTVRSFWSVTPTDVHECLFWKMPGKGLNLLLIIQR